MKKGKRREKSRSERKKEKTGIRVPKADNDVRPSNLPITFLALQANTRDVFSFGV